MKNILFVSTKAGNKIIFEKKIWDSNWKLTGFYSDLKFHFKLIKDLKANYILSFVKAFQIGRYTENHFKKLPKQISQTSTDLFLNSKKIKVKT